MIQWILGVSLSVVLLIGANVFAGEGPPPRAGDAEAAVKKWVDEVLQPWMEKHPGKWEWSSWGRLGATRDATENDLAALLELDGLTTLGLHTFELTDAGLAQVGKLVKLESLSLSGARRVTDVGLAELANLSQLRNLSLSGMPNVTIVGMTELGKLSQLRSLSLGEMPKIADAEYAFLKQFPNLESFSVYGLGDGSGLGDDAIDHLLSLNSLKSVYLQGNKTTDAGLAKLASLTNLNRLGLGYTDRITGDGFAALETLPALKELSLTAGFVTDRMLANVARLPHLQFVDLTQLFNATGEGIVLLADIPALEKMWVQLTPTVVDADLPAFARFTNLRELRFQLCENVSADAVAELRTAMPECQIHHFNRGR